MTSPTNLPSLLIDLRILVVDDEPELLEILDEWFRCFGLRVRTAADGYAAIALAKAEAFDIVITDLKMPGLDGLQLLGKLKALDPAVEVIFLTGNATIDDAIAALREGRAFDFLQKPLQNLAQLNDVIGRAAVRRRKALQSGPHVAHPVPEHLEELSPREAEIMTLLAQGLDNREIAERLCNSEKTIKNHLTRIYEKLKVKNRTQALLTVQQYHLL